MSKPKTLIEELEGPSILQFTCRPGHHPKDLKLFISLSDYIWQDLSTDVEWHSGVKVSFPITVVGESIKIVTEAEEGENWGTVYISHHNGFKVIWI